MKYKFTPFIPGESTLQKSMIPDSVLKLLSTSSKLFGMLNPYTREQIQKYMQIINSYYSNLIEGNRTKPHEIRKAQKGDYSKDPVKRDLQLESIAHIETQKWITEQNLTFDDIMSPDFFKSIHKKFYEEIPKSLWWIKSSDGKKKEKIKPGKFRNSNVSIGEYMPPDHKEINGLIKQFCKIYHPSSYSGEKKIIAALCAHHRFVWIHPFADGNGRIVRLFTDTVLKHLGLESYGVWCLSRGLARSSDQYKDLLSEADMPRKNALDGRGQLSDEKLVKFCDYMINTAIDQVEYMNGLLSLTKIQERITNYVQARNDDRVFGISEKIKPISSLILYNAFISGELKRSTAFQLCAVPERTARRIIKQLINEGLLEETSSRSPLKWAIPEHAVPWYFPHLTEEYSGK